MRNPGLELANAFSVIFRSEAETRTDCFMKVILFGANPVDGESSCQMDHLVIESAHINQSYQILQLNEEEL
jgi:hypothetical protein